jgi:ATP-binding cassette subfamily E protein 1
MKTKRAGATVKKRIAVIDYKKCNPQKCGGYYCEKVCPVNRNGKKCITHEEGQKPVISEELCIGCIICEHKCPFGAITIVNTALDLNEPIHSYGVNSFRLYGLPTPKENSTLGFVGRNGTGKTTIIKILNGEIIPNFGEKDISKEDVINYYKGKEEQAFFEKLYKGNMSFAIKPQNIEIINAKGSVEDLLKKVDTTNRLKEVVEDLNLETLLKKDASKLSGGEFQKIAIAATGLKDADLYFFDEPTSFLDIRERLRVARFIRKLSTNKSVVVIEHDLILLDYLSDFVNLIYGKPSVYGVASQLKTTREGINDYLEGYARDENYRFREYAIDFFSGERVENKKDAEKIVEWEKITKTLGDFNLEVENNFLYKNDVVGVVGPNGIGKTTLMKILAGELKSDTGKINSKVTVSYKPQYVSYTGEKTVKELFEEIDLNKIKTTLIDPLEINVLLEKKAKNLSGGELQRVSIALCLGREADLYLLDEPSAYLDVEQRINVGKTIRNHISLNDSASLIIDHDLTFIDYVSDKIMVFKGESAKKGFATGPFSVSKGMNELLKYLDITVRRDKDTKRPRINKYDSVLDREQKKEGNYYK